MAPGFNPRVLAGGRDADLAAYTAGGLVSIHASSREDATGSSAVFAGSGSGFNPRVLAGGRDEQEKEVRIIGMFQSTRPRGRTRPRQVQNAFISYRFNPRVLAGGRDIVTWGDS